MTHDAEYDFTADGNDFFRVQGADFCVQDEDVDLFPHSYFGYYTWLCTAVDEDGWKDGVLIPYNPN